MPRPGPAEPVAVIAAGLKAPGGNSPEDSWESLCSGRSHAERFKDDRLPDDAPILVARVSASIEAERLLVRSDGVGKSEFRLVPGTFAIGNEGGDVLRRPFLHRRAFGRRQRDAQVVEEPEGDLLLGVEHVVEAHLLGDRWLHLTSRRIGDANAHAHGIGLRVERTVHYASRLDEAPDSWRGGRIRAA